MRRWLWWSVVAGGVIIVAVFVFVRGMGISARREPAPGEERIAKAAWRFLIPRDVRAAVNPVPDTPEVLREGLEHFADHCATCHANNGRGETTIGRRVYPKTPDLHARRTQSLSDGELFYAIEQGIPWTAMPAWGDGTPEGIRGSWELVRFIRHLPALTPDELTAMERFNPRSPADLEQDKAIDDFLRGKAGPPKPVKGHQHK